MGGLRIRDRPVSQDEQFRRFVAAYLPALLRRAYRLLRGATVRGVPSDLH
jgi:hypothetical protein